MGTLHKYYNVDCQMETMITQRCIQKQLHLLMIISVHFVLHWIDFPHLLILSWSASSKNEPCRQHWSPPSYVSMKQMSFFSARRSLIGRGWQWLLKGAPSMVPLFPSAQTQSGPCVSTRRRFVAARDLWIEKSAPLPRAIIKGKAPTRALKTNVDSQH